VLSYEHGFLSSHASLMKVPIVKMIQGWKITAKMITTNDEIEKYKGDEGDNRRLYKYHPFSNCEGCLADEATFRQSTS